MIFFFTGGVRMVFRVISFQEARYCHYARRNQKRLRTLVGCAGETGSLAIGAWLRATRICRATRLLRSTTIPASVSFAFTVSRS